MSYTIILSDYRQTKELNYLIKDKQENYFSHENCFAKILDNFLDKLKEEDRKIAIITLDQIFPELKLQNNMTQQQVYQSIIDSPTKSDKSYSRINFTTPDPRSNRMVLDITYYEEFDNVRKTQDWMRLKQMVQQNQFYMDGKYPNNFIKLVPFIEKLKNKSFLLIDIAEQFLDCQFQLNLSIVKGLLFYFYLPNDFNLTQDESQEIEQLIGEIINQSWLQFEYHQFQLLQSNDNQKQLELLKVIPKMLFETPEKQRDIIEQEFRNILKIKDTALLQEDLEYFIQKQLPILFEIQRLYYQICFYFLSVFHQQYKKNKRLYETEKNRLLNSYIEEKTQQNSQKQGFSDSQFQDNQLDKCFGNYQVQLTLNKYGGKGINFKSNEQLLQYFIDTNFYYFNKQIHIADISQQNISYAKILNLLTEINDEDKRKIATIIKKIIQESQDTLEIVDDLFELKYQYEEEQLEIIFRIICEMLKIDFEEFLVFRFALNKNFKRKHIPNLKKISQIKENMKIQQLIQQIKNFDKEFWEIMQQKIHKSYCAIINSIIQHQMQNQQGMQKDAIIILRDRFNQNSKLQKYNQNTYLFFHLLQNLQDEEVNLLFIENQKQSIPLQAYLSSVNILFKVFCSLSNDSDQQQFKTNLEKGLKLFTSYHLNFLIQLAQNQISKDILDKIYTLVYNWVFKKKNQLEQEAQSFFKNDSSLYQKIFSKINYFDNEQLTSEHLEYIEKKELCDIYPRSLQIGVEEFNITLVQLNQQDQDQLIQNWVQDIKNNKKFKDLIPFYFNIIKRGESSTNFLEMINQQLQNQQELVVKYGYFNQKSMIQLLYNNSNIELQCYILKQISQDYPVPLLYMVPFEEKTRKLEQLTFNLNTYYVHQKSFTIINLSLQKNQRRLGKTQLINKIFYQQEKFEIQDSNKLNNYSIDMMYDFAFQGTRNLSIADVHNFIPLQILDDILPIFKLWIVQLDTEKEIETTIQILGQLNSFQLQDKIVCFLIRDSSFQLEQAQIEKLKQLNIEYKQVVNLTDNNLNKYVLDNEIKKVSLFLYDLIEKKQNNNMIDADQYSKLISQIKNQSLEQTQQIGQDSQILSQIEYELYQLNEQQDLSTIMNCFCSLFQNQNFYALYLKFKDILQLFNEKNQKQRNLTNGQLWDMVIQIQQKHQGDQIQINPYEIIEKLIFKGEPYQFLDSLQFGEQMEFFKYIIIKTNQGQYGKTLFISILGYSGSRNSIILNRIFGCQVQRSSNINTKSFIFQLLKIYDKSIFGDLFEYVILLDSKVLQDQTQDYPEIDKKIGLFILTISDIIIVNNDGDIKTEFQQFIETNIYYMAKLVNTPKQIIFCFNYESKYALFEQKLKNIVKNLQQEFIYQNDDKKAKYYDDIFQIDVNLQHIQVLGFMETDYIWKQHKNQGMIQNWRQIIKNDGFFDDACNFGIQNIQTFIKKIKKEGQSRLQLQNIDEIWEQIKNIDDLQEFRKLKQFQQNHFMKQQYNQIVSNINFPNDTEIIQSITNSLDQNRHILSIEILNDIYNEQKQHLKQYDQILLEENEKLKSIQDEKKISNKILFKYQNQITIMINQKKEQTSNIINQQLQHLDEFQQIVDLQQDQLMSDKLNQILKNQTFPEKQHFITNIQQQIQQNNEDVTTEKLELIKIEQIKVADQVFTQTQEQLIQKIEVLQKENNIKEEIIQKYQAKISEQKHNELQACNYAIYSETKNIQENLSKTQEQNLVQFKIKEVQQNPNMMKDLKENPEKIEAVYNVVQNLVKQNKEKQDDTLFKDRCNEIFDIIQSQFKGYSLQSAQQENYKFAFLEKLIKDQPNQQDYSIQYNILQQELQQTQFKVLEKTDKKQFQESFTANIENKLASSFNQPILQINKFYQKTITIKCIKKDQFESYMNNGDMLKDFEAEIKNDEKQKMQTFLAKFTIFDFEIINEKVDQLCQVIQNGITGQQKQESLLQCFKPIQKQGSQIILNEDSINKIQNNCQQLIKHLKQTEDIEVNDYSEIDTEKQKNYYLIETKPITIQVQKNFKQQNQLKIDIFNYIMNQKKDLELKFNSNIVQIIQEQMNDEQQHSWNILYQQIYQIVYDDMLVKNIVTASQDNFGGLIKRLIQKIEIQIKDFNKQFSQFGVLLNEIGEKCIFNYVIFMIWRIVCFKYWEQKKKNDEKEYKNLEQDLFIKFKADLLQDKQEQSQIRGKQQATEIIKLQYQRLYQNYMTEVKGLIANYDKETSFELIQRLDKEILERQNNSITNSQMLEYIKNHASFIEIYVQQNLDQIKSTIYQRLSKKLKDDMKFFLEQIIKNTKKLNDFKQNIVAQEFFVHLQNPDEAPSLLYKVVFSCIQGTVDQTLINLIKPDMIHLFQIQDCHKFSVILKNHLQNKLDEEIQILNDFMQAFNQKIQEEVKELDQLKIDFNKLDVQSYLDALQVKQIGCQESCPICKRKCDLELDSNHKHQCRNGHQLRGMSGVLIGCNPSLFTCEEIQDYCKVQVMETKNIKYWGDIKAIYNDWLFSCIDVTEKRQFLKKKFTNIWNLNVGQMICKQLSQEIGQEIQFITQEDFDNEQIQRAPKIMHYVIMLDDSGSMRGNKFDSAKSGIIAFLSEIHKMKNKDSRVTIIMFNSNARIVVDSEVINPKEQEGKIVFEGGGTDFDEPFIQAYQKIIQRPDFEKFYQHSMFFYTDGDAGYPSKALSQFEKLSSEQKQKIELVACTEGKPLPALQKVVAFFKENKFASAELLPSIKPEQIGSTWIETISQKTHQIQKLG